MANGSGRRRTPAEKVSVSAGQLTQEELDLVHVNVQTVLANEERTLTGCKREDTEATVQQTATWWQTALPDYAAAVQPLVGDVADEYQLMVFLSEDLKVRMGKLT